jgi:hypothetical protein
MWDKKQGTRRMSKKTVRDEILYSDGSSHTFIREWHLSQGEEKCL